MVFIVGSSFAQGDQPSQAWKSFTSPNTTSGGAAIRVLRSMRYVAGRVAMMITSTSTTAATPIRILRSMSVYLHRAARERRPE